MVLGQGPAPHCAAQLLDPLGAVVFDVEIDELQSGRTDRRERGVDMEIVPQFVVTPRDRQLCRTLYAQAPLDQLQAAQSRKPEDGAGDAESDLAAAKAKPDYGDEPEGRRRGQAEDRVAALQDRPPMKPTPVRMPSGMRMRSSTTKESGALPTLFISQLA